MTKPNKPRYLSATAQQRGTIGHKLAVAQARENYRVYARRTQAAFDEAVAAVRARGLSRVQAMAIVCREQPKLWQDVRDLRPV